MKNYKVENLKLMSISRENGVFDCEDKVSFEDKNGVPCTYRKQWHQGVVNGAVEEVISKMAHDSLFAEAIKQRISSKVDTVEVEKELEDLQKKLRKLTVAKDRVGFQIDGLDFDDVQYERKYQDLQTRLETLYDEIYSTEGEIHQVEIRLKNIEESRITTDNMPIITPPSRSGWTRTARAGVRKTTPTTITRESVYESDFYENG